MEHSIKLGLGMAKNAIVAFKNIWKDKNISLSMKKRLLNTLVFSIASFGLECWLLKNSDMKQLESFEL